MKFLLAVTFSVLLFTLQAAGLPQQQNTGSDQSHQQQQNQQNQQNAGQQQQQQPFQNPWGAAFGPQNPTGGIQAIFTPFLHAGASIFHTGFEIGKGIVEMPKRAMNDLQTGITGFFNAFANPIWVAPTRRPYDTPLGELLSQFPPTQAPSTTDQPKGTTSKPSQNQNQNQNQNRPSNG